jgi:hypothetical protein
MGIPIWPDNHWQHAWEQVDLVAAGPDRRQSAGLGKQIGEAELQILQDIVDGCQRR